MTMQVLSLAIAAGSGIFMALQGQFNSRLTDEVGLLETSLVMHVIGLILLIILIFVFKLGKGNLAEIKNVPKLYLTTGILSVAITCMVAYAILKGNVNTATTAIIVGQTVAAFVINHLGLFGSEHKPIGATAIMGFVLFFIGAYLLLRR